MKFADFQKLVRMMFEPDASGAPRQRYGSVEARSLNPLVAAYIGDAYYHLFVRRRLLAYEQSKVQVLDRFSAQIVSAAWQARAYQAIESSLTEAERDVFRRGRNAHSHAPRVASVRDYHASTGFEALLGTLWLNGENARLEEIAEAAFQASARAMMAARPEGEESKKGEPKS
ncbi:MAG: ribonuclease III [Schwartzia sp.]|nr:ribonuclease III [Schwartzia sp. (in: firmicutes)]